MAKGSPPAPRQRGEVMDAWLRYDRHACRSPTLADVRGETSSWPTTVAGAEAANTGDGDRRARRAALMQVDWRAAAPVPKLRSEVLRVMRRLSWRRQHLPPPSASCSLLCRFSSRVGPGNGVSGLA